jgi:hypothetical protein
MTRLGLTHNLNKLFKELHIHGSESTDSNLLMDQKLLEKYGPCTEYVQT